MNTTKHIAVITPVFNRADCVKNCLESIASQTVPEGWTLEHVVVDDGSSDQSPEIITEWTRTHPYVKSIIFPKNRGTNAARNAAARATDARWIVFIDSDDMMASGAIQTICNAIDAQPECLHFLFATDDTINCRRSLKDGQALQYDDFLLERISGDFVHCFLRETMVERPFDEELRIFEGLFFLHYYKKDNNICYHSAIVGLRDRSRTDHVTNTLWLTNNKALRRKADAFIYKLENFEDDLSRSDEGRSILGRDLAILYRILVLLGDRTKAAECRRKLIKYGFASNKAVRIFELTYTGPAVWLLIKHLLKLKHSLS